MNPPVPPAYRPRSKWLPWAGFGSAALGVLALRIFEQPLSMLVPPCTLHTFTGLYCPGCGGTRAVRALLHGDLLAAWNFNPLLVVLLPLLVIFVVQASVRERPYRGSAWLGFALAAAIVGFGVARNIPVAPFTALAPH